MTKLMWIALGGAVGTLARYGVIVFCQQKLGPAFPYGTLAVNVLGSFVLGVIMQVGLRSRSVAERRRVRHFAGRRFERHLHECHHGFAHAPGERARHWRAEMRSDDTNMLIMPEAGWTVHHVNQNGARGHPPGHSMISLVTTRAGQVSHTWTHDPPSRGVAAVIATFRGALTD
jgi:hypothetical protein